MSRIQNPRRIAHAARGNIKNTRKFDYELDYKKLDLRRSPELYRVGVGEQGVLLVETYKSEILPHWKFRTPALARVAAVHYGKFVSYRRAEDFVGMDMARKFLQMGFTRSRRYANHKSGRKYDSPLGLLKFDNDPMKARSAEIFYAAWQRAESNKEYSMLKVFWRSAIG